MWGSAASVCTCVATTRAPLCTLQCRPPPRARQFQGRWGPRRHACSCAATDALQISHDNALDTRPYEHMLKVLGDKKQPNGCSV